MPLLESRDIVPFSGDNATDAIINNIHFNLTTLNHWNFTLYSNGTISNGSKCFLTFTPYTPALVLSNGTFVNHTSCYSPTDSIETRGGIGIGFAVLFGIALVPTVVNLKKHGTMHLPAEKRFFPIGRRWQWYWAAFVSATAMISLLTGVDVDRYFLPELPLVLNVFFWFLMQMGTMALVWEAVRHWGSWMERQFIDPDPFTLRDDDWRTKIEFWLPLVFYLFLWLNFFMLIPRSWTKIQHQRYPEQVIIDAEPSATDARFKAAAFLLIVCWLITIFSLRHSIKHYCPRNRGIINRFTGFVRYIPTRFMILLPLAAVVPAYQALVAWDFAHSPLNLQGNLTAIYVGGYTPSLLILYINILFGFLRPNEDLELQRQRRVRGQDLDREMGIVHKPSWWRRKNPANENMRDRLTRNVREIHGDRATAGAGATADASGRVVEMGPVSPTSPRMNRPAAAQYVGKSQTRRQEREAEIAAGMLFPEASERSAAATARRRQELMMDGPVPAVSPSMARTRQEELMMDGPVPPMSPNAPRRREEELMMDGPVSPPPPPYRPLAAQRGSGSISAQSTGSTNQPPQQIRSMLDV